MLAAVRSATLIGVDGQPVTVEVHVSSGLPAYQVVGLPDAAVRESRERVRAAVLSSGLEWPQRRITVNLAPGGVRKSGSGLELAVALGLLGANDALPAGVLDGVAVLGELGLDGSVRPVPGTLALVDALARAGVGAVVVPVANASEAELVGGVRVRAARTLGELRACLKGEEPWPDWDPPAADPDRDLEAALGDDELVDLADVRGLPFARQALEVAAAGGHHLLFCGPPGTGKTMLARRLGTILPPLSPAEALEVTRIHSAAGEPVAGRLVGRRPFRAPHHTASTAALVGGGSGRARPGEITLAHRGVLFLDELGEFAPSSLDALRQPLEERAVRISRQPVSLTFPAAFQLIACSNPCPCGSGAQGCRCSDAQRERYRRRLSAPLLDRFDLRVRVDAPEAADVRGERSADVALRVAAAFERQRARYADWPWSQNAHVAAGAVAAPALARARRRRRLAVPHRRAQPHRSGRHPDTTRRPHSGRPRRRGRDHRRPPRSGIGDAGRRAVSADRDRARPPRPPRDPVEVAAATLACLPDMTPKRLRGLIERVGGPVGALAALDRGLGSAVLCDGTSATDLPARAALARIWQEAAHTARVDQLLRERATHVFVEGRPGYPIDDLPEPPVVLLAEGERPEALGRRRVAVVGTRAATPHGLEDAYELGAVLARAGVTVVSGLAIGIDAAAHEGALDAGGAVVGVVGTGLDVVYPRRHRVLFDRVRGAGLLVSELGYGVQPRRQAFPVRNRIIAGLAEVVVVVEATLKGGARITAERALEYGRTVMAYPGSRRNPSAAGTNALLYDGAGVVLEPSDVLVALELEHGAPRLDLRTPPVGEAAAVLRACHGEPATLDQLASRTALAPSTVVAAVRALERDRWMERARGLCWPR